MHPISKLLKKTFQNAYTYTCTYMIANIANIIAPVLPDASLKIKKMLNLPKYKWEEVNLNGNYKIQDLEVLYERLDEKKNLTFDDNQESVIKNTKRR